MDYREYKRMQDSVEDLNAKYGNFFGNKLVLYTVITSIIFTLIVLGIQGLKKIKDHNTQFVLDSKRKYIISMVLPETDSYYEVDFNKGEVIYRKDSDILKREKLGKVRTNLEELEKFLFNITNDQNNLYITEEESQKLYKQNCYRIYKITTYEQKEYYVKENDKIEYLKEMLSKR